MRATMCLEAVGMLISFSAFECRRRVSSGEELLSRRPVGRYRGVAAQR